MREYRNEPDWIGIDAHRFRDHGKRHQVTLQMKKETKQPVGFAPSQPSPIVVPRGYRTAKR